MYIFSFTQIHNIFKVSFSLGPELLGVKGENKCFSTAKNDYHYSIKVDHQAPARSINFDTESRSQYVICTKQQELEHNTSETMLRIPYT